MYIMNIINWDENPSEPVLTLSLFSEELRQFYERPMSVPVLGLHIQSIERCVKQVTIAAGKVYGEQNRVGTSETQLLTEREYQCSIP